MRKFEGVLKNLRARSWWIMARKTVLNDRLLPIYIMGLMILAAYGVGSVLFMLNTVTVPRLENFASLIALKFYLGFAVFSGAGFLFFLGQSLRDVYRAAKNAAR
ncbi:hypothetical protein [Acidithiobacillus ferriphilus]|uniref:hypothetical protein n=1 Tax=Acidithiobacillus ferriphilus TaxID=1689834 RepID=UPI002DBCD556|nr:hypothetical protein [Acidithiobacillus ferriphilus]MEB8474043.1 hypothetical protein [Acidithiobacillus ferriphilus]